MRLKWLSFRELGMKKLISLLVVAIFSASLAVTAASAKTAKECLAEWRADKAGMQARGTTEKAYVDQCKDGAAPTVSWPRLSEQNLRIDKWSVCRVRPPSGMAAG